MPVPRIRLSVWLPARKHVERVASAAHWLARADRVGAAEPGRVSTLRESFAVAGAAMPVAALTRAVDVGDAEQALWLRADPAFVMADAVTLRLFACGNLAVSSEEIAAFAAVLKPLFAEVGLQFDAPHPQRWYLRCPPGARLPSFSAPADALGDDLGRHLPQGDEARRWRGLLNEAQIVLTQHPANVRRAQRGLAPVNSLWFWGAGTLPACADCGFAQVYSEDAVVAALAGLAKIGKFGVPAAARELLSPPSVAASKDRAAHGDTDASVLIDLAHYRDMAQLESDWLAPIEVALKHRRIARLDLRFESGERYTVKPQHRWRFWRRVKTTA